MFFESFFRGERRFAGYVTTGRDPTAGLASPRRKVIVFHPQQRFRHDGLELSHKCAVAYIYSCLSRGSAGAARREKTVMGA